MTAEIPAPTTVSAPSARPQPTLVVRTIAIDDLPDGPAALIDLLPDARPLSWVRRGEGIVGWGEALRLETYGPGRFADAEAAWQEALARAVVRDEVHVPGAGPVAFGSFAFDDVVGADGDARPCGVLIVPRVVVGRRGTTTWLTTIDATGSLSHSPGTHLLDPDGRTPVSSPGEVVEHPGALGTEDWAAVVQEATRRIRDGEVDKVVLARDVVTTAERPVDARWLLANLAQNYPSCWTFSVDGLAGATPELLVRSEKGLVTSRVLAGTIRRAAPLPDDGPDPAVFLASSSKDLEEHEYAVRSVADALEPFCSSMNVPDAPFVLHLPNVLHLASDVTGVLGHTVAEESSEGRTPSSLALAAALHPSAAVCGTPTTAAREMIREIEGMDRGRYAGPVGWLGADGDGEWGIALRCAEISHADPRTVRLFAGCGIVAASDSRAELVESEAKLEPVRSALRGIWNHP
ncbi:isochorismate synthase [Paraoerskovia marina]|uniref:isochorismate synthase n=1 Tax=Paraoerskovia marina TaxID=545619 RepID=A0A1H1VJU4_9CELL|nr:isochorismate synthase [Paraoerskovia marina]SDS84576.1 isochorismate synthase [Paraoerskovia marina]